MRSLITPNNGWSFNCQTVGRDVKYMVCQYLKFKLWRGEDIPTKDCACAMRGGKCPAIELQKIEWREGKTFFDAEITMHRLPTEVLNKIANIILVESQANGDDLTIEQRQRLFERPSVEKSRTQPDVKSTKRAPKNSCVKLDDLTDGLANIEHEKSVLLNTAMGNA